MSNCSHHLVAASLTITKSQALVCAAARGVRARQSVRRAAAHSPRQVAAGERESEGARDVGQVAAVTRGDRVSQHGGRAGVFAPLPGGDQILPARQGLC